MKEVVIVSAARTPFGKFGGGLKSFNASDLGGFSIKEALERVKLLGSKVDEVIYGVVVPAGQGQNPGRQAAVKGGIPHQVPVTTVNKVCASALKAVTMGAALIKAGDAEVVVAGGMESMTNMPYLTEDMRWGARMGKVSFKDAMIQDGLWCPENDVHMAVIGGTVASEYKITREMQDEWALRSQKKWAEAEKKGYFNEELFPVDVTSRKGTVTISKDEAPRPETTEEALAKLKPLFIKDGTITAGNAPGTNDGATALVLMSREKANELGLTALAVVKDYAQVSEESRYISTVPGLAMEKLMKQNKLTVAEVDLLEVNEVFAAVPLVSCLGVLGMDEDEMDQKVNVNGGAVAVGHPIGATGGRILMTLMYELKRQGKKSGIASICSGMGQGDAIWIEVE